MQILKSKEMVGQKFGRLTVVSEAPRLSAKNVRWNCLCECGGKTIVQGGTLRTGKQKSCGCLQIESAFKHGQEGTKVYFAWAAIKQRCLNKKCKSYKDYGARGINIFEEWLKFENFYAAVGDAPDGMSIDRIDNQKGYEPGNIRWTSMEVQNNNRRITVLISMFGKTQSLTMWAREYKISPISIKSRLKLGWSFEDALLKPIDKRYSNKRSAKKLTPTS